MLPSNIESEVEKILKRNNGWLRTEECAKAYSNNDGTKRTEFYRWRKKIEKGKIKGFQVIKFPNNISFIGLEKSDPEALKRLLTNDKKISRLLKSGFGLFDYIKWRSERKKHEKEKAERELLAQKRTYLELTAKLIPEAESLKDWVEIEKKNRKELGLDQE